MKMKEIKTLSDIDTTTIEGKMLVCAINELCAIEEISKQWITDTSVPSNEIVISELNKEVALKFPPPERWVNVYVHNAISRDTDESSAGLIYSSYEDARKAGINHSNYLETVQLVSKKKSDICNEYPAA